MEVLHRGYPLVYLRGGRYLVVITHRREPPPHGSRGPDRVLPEAGGDLRLLEGDGVRVEGRRITTGGFRYGVLTTSAA